MRAKALFKSGSSTKLAASYLASSKVPRALKRCVTLLEMVLVIALLAIVGSVAGFFSFKASKQEEFASSVEAVLGRLQLAEELMILGNDLTISFKRGKGQLHVVLEPDRPLDKTSMKLLALPSPIRGIEKVVFVDSEITPMDRIRLNYASFGMLRPKGELRLEGPYGSRSIPLTSHSLSLEEGASGKINQKFFSEELYPYDVLPQAKKAISPS